MCARHQDVQRQANHEKANCQIRRGPRQSVCGAARAEKAAQTATTTAATANTERAAFRALQQDEHDQKDRDDEFEREKQGLHGQAFCGNRAFKGSRPAWEAGRHPAAFSSSISAASERAALRA